MGVICTKEDHSLTPRGPVRTPAQIDPKNSSFYILASPEPHVRTSLPEIIRNNSTENDKSLHQPQIKSVPPISNPALRYREVTGKYLHVQGSWLGNVMGTVDIASTSFANNPQFLFRVYKQKTKINFFVSQDASVTERRVACVMIFKIDSHGDLVQKFSQETLIAASKCTMSDFSFSVELDDVGFPYVIVVSQRAEQEGSFGLCIEANNECTLASPQNAISWFDTLPHHVTMNGEWKGPSAAGNPDSKSWTNSPQYPMSISTSTRCTITLLRKLECCLSMGLLVLRSNNVLGKYSSDKLNESDIVAKYTKFTSNEQITLHMFLEPYKFPYVIIPLVASQGMEGKYTIKVQSDKQVEMHSDKSNTIEYIEKGVWIARQCGGNFGDETFFNSPQFFLKVMKSTEVTIYQDQLVDFGRCLNAGFYVLKGSAKVTQDNFKESDIVFIKPTSFSASVNSKLKLSKGEYVILCSPRTSHFGNNVPLQIRVTTLEPNAVSLEGSPENVENFETNGFLVAKLNGEWEGYTSGGGPESAGFFNNPQFILTVTEKTKTEVILHRLTEHWMPMAFFIVLMSDGDRVTKKEFQQAGSLIGKVNFTSGIPDFVSAKYVLLPGRYAIIASSQIEGRKGFFSLTIKSNIKVDLKQAPKVEYQKISFDRGFIGGKYGIRISDKFFHLSPIYHVYVSTSTQVFVSVNPSVVESKILEVPQKFTESFSLKTTSISTEKRLPVCVYIFKPGSALHENNLICTSGIGNWKNVCCSAHLEPSEQPYQIVVCTNERKEGEYMIHFCSKSKIEVEEYKNITEFFSDSTLLKQYFTGEWTGLHAGGPPGTNKMWIYNPRYSLNVTENTKLVITMNREKQNQLLGIGFCLLQSGVTVKQRLHDDDYLIMSDSFAEISLTQIQARAILAPQAKPYTLVFFSNIPLRAGRFSFTIASDNPTTVANINQFNILKKSFNASWSVGTRGGGSYDSPCFRNNPQWIIKAAQPVDVVVELEQALLPVTQGMERKDMQQMKQEEKMERIQQLFGFESSSKNETKYLSIGLFLIKLDKSYSDLRLLPDKIRYENIIAQSGWKFHSKATLSFTIEPSELPYFIVPSTLSEGQANQFKLTLYSSAAVDISPVDGTVYEGFQLSDDFKKQSFSDSWVGLSAAGSPKESLAWMNNPTFLLTVSNLTKCRIELKKKGTYTYHMGLVVLQPKTGSSCSSDFQDNFIFAEAVTKEAYVTQLDIQLHLQPSVVPYRVVAYAQEGIEDDFEVVVYTDISTQITKYAFENQALEMKIDGYWNGNNALDTTHSAFSNNPHIYLNIASPQDIIIYLDNPLYKLCSLYVYQLPAKGSFKIGANSLTKSNYTCKASNFYKIPMKKITGNLVILPALEHGVSAPFAVRIYAQRSAGISVKHDFTTSIPKIISTPSVMKLQGRWENDMMMADFLSHPHIHIKLQQQSLVNVKLLTRVPAEKVCAVLKLRDSDIKKAIYYQSVSPFQSSSVHSFFLDQGEYNIIFYAFEVGEFFVEAEHETTSKSVIKLYSLEHCETFPEICIPDVESFDTSIILQGVKELPFPSSTVSSLCIYGPNSYPLILAQSAGFMPDKCEANNRELTKIDRMIVSSDEPVTFYEAYAAVGRFGNGRIVAIADSRAFDTQNFDSYNSPVFLTNIFQHINQNQEWNILCYCANTECLSTSIIKHLKEHVAITSSFSQFCSSIMQGECTSVIMVFSPIEKFTDKELLPVTTFIQQGGGALVLGNLSESIPSNEYAGNVLLSKAGIVFSSGKLQQLEDKHRSIWWLSKDTVNNLLSIKSTSAISKQPKFVISQNQQPVHVATCLKQVLEWHQNNSWPSLQICSPYIHILVKACTSISYLDKIIMPILRDKFINPNVIACPESPILHTNYTDYISTAIATNFIFSFPNDRCTAHVQSTIFPGRVPLSISRSKSIKAQLGTTYHYHLSTGIYVPPGENISITLPPSLVNIGCKLQIGCHSDSFLEYRQRNLLRYPKMCSVHEVNNIEMDIFNPFGGLLYVHIPRSVFTTFISSGKDIRADGAVEAPIFKNGVTSIDLWRQIQLDKTVPFAEFVGKYVAIALPTSAALSCDDPSVVLTFWDNVIQTICTALHVPIEPQRIVFDVQLSSGKSRSGYPCMFTFEYLEYLLNPSADVLMKDGGIILHELCHSILNQDNSPYLWKGRTEPIINLLMHYVFEKVFNKKIDDFTFFADMCTTVKSHLMNTEMNQKGKYMVYRDDSSGLSSMFELILVHNFGWHAYEQLWNEYHSKNNAVILTDQEKIDDWISRYSELVQRDIRPYFESWGFVTKAKLHSKLPHWSFA